MSEPSKRIIVCCDGTAYSAYYGEKPFTNVSRIARCIKSATSKGTPQVVHYVPGIGTNDGNPFNIYNQGFGIGIDERIIDAYSFICHNYSGEKDQIILIGFSRGGFVVRCVADIVCKVGLLTKRGLAYLRPLYDMWSNGEFKDPQTPGEEEVSDPSAFDEDAPIDVDFSKELDAGKKVDSEGKPKLNKKNEFRKRLLGDTRLLNRHVRIKVCAVWDTVSSVGFPKVGRFQRPAPPNRLNFVHSELCKGIDYAFQALSLHEYRQPFLPIVWKIQNDTQPEAQMPQVPEVPKIAAQYLRQCWFLGYHGDIGGGNDLEGLAHIPLAWMIARLQYFITFDESHFWRPRLKDSAWNWSKDAEEEHGFKAKLRIPDTMTYGYWLGGANYRKPRRQFWEEGGFEDNRNPEEDTAQYRSEEAIHWTVRLVKDLKALDSCQALKEAEPKSTEACQCGNNRHERVWKIPMIKERNWMDVVWWRPVPETEYYFVCEETKFYEPPKPQPDTQENEESEIGGDDEDMGENIDEEENEDKRRDDNEGESEDKTAKYLEIRLLEIWFDSELKNLQRTAEADSPEPQTAIAEFKCWLWEAIVKEEVQGDYEGEAESEDEYEPDN